MESTLVWIDSQKMPEQWEAMWSELERLEGDRVCENCDEVWQYMGSKTLGDTITHSFRHRYHPSTNGRKAIQIVLPHHPTPESRHHGEPQ